MQENSEGELLGEFSMSFGSTLPLTNPGTSLLPLKNVFEQKTISFRCALVRDDETVGVVCGKMKSNAH